MMSWKNDNAFSMVEILVVMTILAILGTVAVPAYINHTNRARQTDAIVALTTIQLEQEAFYEKANYASYAATIGCLPSFNTGSNTCLSNCATCSQTTYLTNKGYTVSITSATTNTFVARAFKTYYSGRPADTITIAATSAAPSVKNTEALGFSLFSWFLK
jgi:type IV pilus assembly protein PilE